MVVVRVISSRTTTRLERALIAECREPYMWIVWIFDLTMFRQALQGIIDSPYGWGLSIYCDIVPVRSLERLVSPDERDKTCTDWVLYDLVPCENQAKAFRINEPHADCFLRRLLGKTRAREPSRGSPAPDEPLDGTPPRQDVPLTEQQSEASAVDSTPAVDNPISIEQQDGDPDTPIQPHSPRTPPTPEGYINFDDEADNDNDAAAFPRPNPPPLRKPLPRPSPPSHPTPPL